jgi:hypothetical protein
MFAFAQTLHTRDTTMRHQVPHGPRGTVNVLSESVGTINQNNFSLPGLVVSFIGASILLAIVNLLRRGTTR